MIAKFSRIASIDCGKYLLLGTSLTSIVKTSVPLRQNIKLQSKTEAKFIYNQYWKSSFGFVDEIHLSIKMNFA